MKNKTLVALFITLGMISCDNEENNCSPESVHSKWTLGKEIIVEYNQEYERNEYNIVDGENRLFEYNHSGAQCADIMDDEWGEKLIFTLNNETSNFEFTDEEIIQTNCFYQEYGAWVSHNKYQIKNGTIKGEKISKDKWLIDVSITTTPLFEHEQAKTIEFIETFHE